MKKILYIILIIIVLSFYLTNQNNPIIPSNSIRFRIIANSNSNIDQTTKKQIKKDLETSFFPLLDKSKSLTETRNIIKNNEYIIKNTLDSYNIPYTINYGTNYFPKKTYKGINYDEGQYESLVISLGEAKGNNWWCVMYPPLCLLDMNDEEEDYNEVEYKFYIQEIISKLTS